MKAIIAIALLALAGCDSVIYGRDQYGNINYPPRAPIDPGVAGMLLGGGRPTYQMPTGYQSVTLPSGRMMSCTSIGTHTSCF